MNNRAQNALAAIVAEMIQKGECAVEKRDSRVIYKIRPTKIGQKRGKTASIEEINKAIGRGLILGREKRIKRKRNELPDPSAGPKDEVNRLTKMLNIRISPEHVETFNRIASRYSTKRAAMEKAIKLLADEAGIDIDDP